MNDYQLIKDFIEFKDQTYATIHELHQRIEQLENMQKGGESNDERPEL